MCIVFLMENSNKSRNVFKIQTFKKSAFVYVYCISQGILYELKSISFTLVFLTKDKYYKFYNTTTWHLYINSFRHYLLENKKSFVCVLHEKWNTYKQKIYFLNLGIKFIRGIFSIGCIRKSLSKTSKVERSDDIVRIFLFLPYLPLYCSVEVITPS
jgi:hypothetical protein